MNSPARLQVLGRIMLVPAMIGAILGGCMFFDEIDRCLDRGGRWDHATDTCELREQPEGEQDGFEAPTTSRISSSIES